MNSPFKKISYYALTLDPVHVGTGGFRLGRVDNTIVREPGTRVPKIPGSSIAGVARACTALAIQSSDATKQKYLKPVLNADGSQLLRDGKHLYYSCAGKGADDGKGHCGENNCGVCATYGFSKEKESFQGLAQFYDARIIFFPVQSSTGPVWITSPSLLREYYDQKIELTETIQTCMVEKDEPINIGWLYLKNEKKEAPLTIANVPESVSTQLIPIINRLILVPENYFSHIINDNLEVRTSVAIDPQTGAAESGALFTYEAIPRATILLFDVVYNDPHYFLIGGKTICKDDKMPADTAWVRENVKKGLDYLQYVGLGGMNTRGMGRIRILEA